VKPVPPFLVLDSSNSLTLGVGNTEKEAVAAASKYLDTPRRVTIHNMGPNGYTKRTAVMDADGLVSK
jgi:hypothetical protein